MDEKQYELAAEVTERRIENAIRNITAKPGRESATHCEDCGEDIPEARREAVKGCTRCAACQSIAEEKGKHYR